MSSLSVSDPEGHICKVPKAAVPPHATLTFVFHSELPRFACWDQGVGPNVTALAPVEEIGKEGVGVGKRIRKSARPTLMDHQKKLFIWKNLHPRRMHRTLHISRPLSWDPCSYSVLFLGAWFSAIGVILAQPSTTSDPQGLAMSKGKFLVICRLPPVASKPTGSRNDQEQTSGKGCLPL